MRIYCTSYCNKGHDLDTGKPINHECRKLPTAALEAERMGHYELAIRLLQGDRLGATL